MTEQTDQPRRPSRKPSLEESLNPRDLRRDHVPSRSIRVKAPHVFVVLPGGDSSGN